MISAPDLAILEAGRLGEAPCSDSTASPCTSGCGASPGGTDLEVILRARGVDSDHGDATPDIPSGPVDLETLLEHAAVQLTHCQHLPLSARHKIKSLLAQYDAASGELDRYAFFDPGKRYSEAASTSIRTSCRFLTAPPPPLCTARNLIAQDEHFTLMLLCWNPGKASDTRASARGAGVKGWGRGVGHVDAGGSAHMQRWVLRSVKTHTHAISAPPPPPPPPTPPPSPAGIPHP